MEDPGLSRLMFYREIKMSAALKTTKAKNKFRQKNSFQNYAALTTLLTHEKEDMSDDAFFL